MVELFQQQKKPGRLPITLHYLAVHEDASGAIIGERDHKSGHKRPMCNIFAIFRRKNLRYPLRHIKLRGFSQICEGLPP